MAKRPAIALSLVLLALLLNADLSHAQTQLPPLVQATDTATRLPQLSAVTQALVTELDGQARAAHLLVPVSRAQRRGTLLLLALELQSLLHPSRGNYLYAWYRAVRARRPTSATNWAQHLADQGVAIAMTSGHFEYLAHLDPNEPRPTAPTPTVAQVPITHWLDGFVSARYRVGYRPFSRGSLSQVLHLRYRDGTVLDIDIRVISDNRDPAPALAFAHAYLGPGERIFPLRLNRDTTPRLWRAKHEQALATMHRSNQEFENLAVMGLTAVMVNTPAGLVAPVSGVGSTPRGTPRTQRSARVAHSANTVPPARALTSRAQTVATPARAPVPTHGRIVRRIANPAPLVLSARPKLRWPPAPPRGLKPAPHQPNAASWRYQRYLYNAYRHGATKDKVLPYATWRRRYFDTVVAGGRPGRPGGPAHQADVARNNARPNDLGPEKIGTRFPDGVGKPGQALLIRGQIIKPQGRGRVVVESDHLIRGRTMPNSAARAQTRDIRKAEPGATIVVTDQVNPETPPLVYPPGKQPPPPGRLPKHQAPVTDYP